MSEEDPFESFFNFAKTAKRTINVQGAVDNRVIVEASAPEKVVRRENLGTGYATEFQKTEKVLLANQFLNLPTHAAGTSFDDIDSNFGSDNGDLDKATTEIYNRYSFKMIPREDLPISKAKDLILHEIRNNPVIIITGHTGSGKTTQVPQYILEDCYNNNKNCNIIVTQPRRIATTSIAARVAGERKCELGSLVGYQVGLDQRQSKYNNETRLLFVTTGVLLQKLIHAKEMKQYTHIILDEVHDRDIDMDFLLIVIRKLLATNSPSVKIIMMSATIDAEHFRNYFKVPGLQRLINVPVIVLDSERRFKIEEYYLDSFIKRSPLPPNLIDYDCATILPQMYQFAIKPLLFCLNESCESQQIGSILVFLPGIFEIECFIKTINEQEALFDKLPYKIFVLHSSLAPEDQRNVFKHSEVTKIILATNIAESSITLPDVKYVIDFCLTKYLVTDSSTNLTSLQMNWTSRNSCMQRTGRVGRVCDGFVYRLIHLKFFNDDMVQECPPEMIRSPLETVILKAKLLDMGPPAGILALAIDPPNKSDINNSILVLKEVCALLQFDKGVFVKDDGEMTYIGRIMAVMPMSVRLTKLIVMGYLFSCLEDCIIISAGLNIKSIFCQELRSKIKSYSQKLSWADASGSDCIALLNAYKTWKIRSEQGMFREQRTEIQWCHRFLLEMRHLHDMSELIDDIKRRLEQFELTESSGVYRVMWTDKEKPIILKICLAAAFFPNFFERSNNDETFEKLTYSKVGGNDPFNTVFFTNMESRAIGDLYRDQVKEALIERNICDSMDKMTVTFDSNSTKIYVTFLGDNKSIDGPLDDGKNSGHNIMAGRVLPEVYKCVKQRKIESSMVLRIMDTNTAEKYALDNNLGSIVNGMFKMHKNYLKLPELCVIPSIFVRFMQGTITHVEHCNKFFFQPTSTMIDNKWNAKFEKVLLQLRTLLDKAEYQGCGNFKAVRKGDLMVVNLDDEGFCRGKICQFYVETLSFDVYLIDFGFVRNLPARDLRVMTSKSEFNAIFAIPERCFECTLTEIQPSSIKSLKGKWIPEAVELFNHYTEHQIAIIDVYSVVNDVASVRLIVENIKVNLKLIKKGYAQFCDENYMSKMNYDTREQKQRIGRIDYGPEVEFAEKIDNSKTVNIKSPPMHLCYKKVYLKGPFTPLETSLHGFTHSASTKQIVVDSTSVNSVVLDVDPQDTHEKIYVAATISESSNKGNLTIRDVTLMPNIPGLGLIIALLFAPQIEIRRNKELTRYINVLCGMGFDPDTKLPYFAEHDAVFNVDVNLDLEDLEWINHLRYTMSQLIFLQPLGIKPEVNEKSKGQLKLKVKELIIKILEKDRRYVNIEFEQVAHVWGKNKDRSDIMIKKDLDFGRSVYPFIPVPKVLRRSKTYIDTMLKHVHELKMYSNMETRSQYITCKLCNKQFETVPDLRLHLISKLHKDLEQELITIQ